VVYLAFVAVGSEGGVLVVAHALFLGKYSIVTRLFYYFV